MSTEHTALGQALAAQRRILDLEAELGRLRHDRALAVRRLYAEGNTTQVAISEMLGVSRALVQAIIEERR